MNLQLKELAEQAGYSVDMFGFGIWDSAEFNRFAEMIVFECIKLAVFKGDAKTGKAIKEHFGVKE